MMPLQTEPQHVEQTAGDGDITMPPEYYGIHPREKHHQ